MASVLDSSALLALLWSEPGADAVEALLPGALISAVNMAEVCSKLSDRGISGGEVDGLLDDLRLEVIDFDREQAAETGKLRALTRSLGLSLGDRACLALAARKGLAAVTGDKSWRKLQLQIEIVAIR